ncbi:DUF1002 domain-containing protein [Priestia aryabhattai]|uniref:DUF1002 domain-containing protein n=1 Tax=Priestia aryabhattai TaxID=412384 RepID=A0AAX6NCH0_PRIAR|nr:DUF1002 domain-containing protein [Priestia aryabhattai]MDU9693601.1 DUF1002 domain-containing protein [Priestia aryabhattai]
MKKLITSLGVTAIAVGMINVVNSPIVLADAQPGDVIITLGEDLSVGQKNTVLKDMDVNESDAQIVYVNNGEEHKYLGNYVPESQIGSKSISSAKITLGDKDTGLVVESHNVNYITDDMYLNSLSTAGVKDAKVYVTAPFAVSGTGALTGIIKAYEVSSGTKIDESQKQVANQEMVTTAQLASNDDIGQEKAVEFMSKVKEEISKENPKTEEDIKSIIQKTAVDMNINLTTDQQSQLVDLFGKIKDLHIDWEKVNKTFDAAKEKWNKFAQSEEGKNIIDSFIAFMKSIWHGITALFGSK